MNSLFKYFGSKWTSSGHYPAPQGVVCEPFAGSACYSLRWGVKQALLLDLDERVCALWAYLIRVSPEEILSLPLLGAGERVSSLGLPHEQRLLLSCWVNTSPWCDKMADRKGHWSAPTRARVARTVQAIRGWTIEQADYRSAPETATTFADPPYQHQPKVYKHDSRALDFAELGAWCQARKGLVIVCEQEGADWLPWNGRVPARRAPRADNGKQRGGEGVTYREVYWSNEANNVFDWGAL